MKNKQTNSQPKDVIVDEDDGGKMSKKKKKKKNYRFDQTMLPPLFDVHEAFFVVPKTVVSFSLTDQNRTGMLRLVSMVDIPLLSQLLVILSG